MAHEKQRAFHIDRRVIEAQVEDDFGVVHVVGAAVHTDRCPLCQREYPQEKGHVDFDAMVKEVCEQLSDEAGRVIEIFERHGADMTKHKERRAARLEKTDASHHPAGD